MTVDGPWFPDNRGWASRKYLLSLAAAEANDLAKLQELESLVTKNVEVSNDSSDKTFAARVNALLALAAARRGDTARYRKAAMTVGGYTNRGYRSASKIVFLDLAEATAAAGQPEAAVQFVEQADARGNDADPALLAIAEKMAELGRVPAAKEVVQDIREPIASVRGRYAVAAAEAAASSSSLASIYLEAMDLPQTHDTAAVLAGVAAAIHAD